MGASWWQQSLADTQTPINRRLAIQVALGAGLVVAGVVAIDAFGGSELDAHQERRTSLDMQRLYGWSFGAAQESVTFDGISTRPFDRSALVRMSSDLRPASSSFAVYYVATLFESPSARPGATAEEDPESIVPLDQVLSPIFTSGMRSAYPQGQALGSLLRTERLSDVLVICDLDGPESVAFAAGGSGAFDPIFVFGNWPHPRGVVKAHRTLAAAAYYQPLFAQRQVKGSRAGLIVLDRQRLAPYSDDATQFDNRYVPALPPPDALREWGVRRVLYVTPTASDAALADVQDDLAQYESSGLEVKLVAADAFAPDPADPASGTDTATGSFADTSTSDWGHGGGHYYYGGRASSHNWFWHDYPWTRSGALPRAVEPSFARPGSSYRASAAAAAASPAAHLAGAAALGTVAVAVSRQTGRIMGAFHSRSGSWNRAQGGYGG
jgi:hypothetical protein